MTSSELSAELEQIYAQLCDARGRCSEHPDYHDGSPIEKVDQGLGLAQERIRGLVKLLKSEGKKS